MIKFDQIARKAAKLLAIAGGVTLLSSAFAGHYEVKENTLTSGLTVSMNPGGVVGPIYGPGSCSVPSAGGGGGSGSISGTLKTTYDWKPDFDGDEPPLSVVVVETCEVYMSAQAYPGSTTATASNGLDTRFCTNTSVSNSPIYYYPGYQIGSGSSAYSSGTAAKVVAGGMSIEVSCTPAGTCASGNGPYSAYLNYSAQVYPVTVSVAGTVQWAGVDAALVGKVLQASLSPGAPDVTLKPGSYSWSISGSIFKSFFVSPTQDVGYEVPMPSPISDASPTFCFKDAGESEVTGTATLRYQSLDIGSASAKKEVQAFLPESTLTFTFGTHQVTTSTLVSSGTPFNHAVTMRHNTRIAPIFSVGGDFGVNAICQRVSAYRSISTNPPIISTTKSLDNEFPYPANAYLGWCPGADLSSPIVPPPNQSIDTPAVSLGSSLTEWLVDVNDKFYDTLMFKAAGLSEPVPLRDTGGLTWVWLANAEYDENGVIEHYNVVSGDETSVLTTTFPNWNNKITNL